MLAGREVAIERIVTSQAKPPVGQSADTWYFCEPLLLESSD